MGQAALAASGLTLREMHLWSSQDVVAARKPCEILSRGRTHTVPLCQLFLALK
jgi:hypothetical protein